MTSTEKIIKRIDNGDAGSILTEEAMVEMLNELLKYELIELAGDKLIIITKKGREASSIGIDEVLSKLKIKEELKEFSVEVQKKEFFIFELCLILCMCLLILLIAGIL